MIGGIKSVKTNKIQILERRSLMTKIKMEKIKIMNPHKILESNKIVDKEEVVEVGEEAIDRMKKIQIEHLSIENKKSLIMIRVPIQIRKKK